VWFQRFDVRTIGVTGSVGKSTTKEVIAEVLSQKYKVLKSEGSYNNELGIPLTVFNLEPSHQRAVLEMSMYTIGEIALLTSITPPDVGVVTLIAPVHLERAGSLENIIKAKTELVEALPPSPEGIAILNFDDEHVMGMAHHTQARIVTYGLSPEADFWATDIEGLGLDGIRFWMHHGDMHRQMHLPMLGRHSVHTALRAAATARVEGLSWEEITRGLQSTRNQLRLIAAKGPNGSVILDDTYNASPTSTIAALNLLNDLMEGRRIAVLGDMLELGAEEEIGHARVGVRAAEVADLLVTVGQRARIIAREARRSGLHENQVRSVDSAEEAAEIVLGVLKPGDSVLVKGSRAVGMERIVARLNLEGRNE
jgi:UDP-N-acetylmuramoyl-tripeptide--D-alanyl-D-alanine ligase